MDESQIRETLAENLARLRINAGFKSQEEFAKRIGVTRGSVWKYEHGRNFFPIDKLPSVLKVLECSFEDLFYPIFQNEKDWELDKIFNMVKKIYKIPDGKEEMEKELKKIILMFEDRTIEKKKRKGTPGADGRANSMGAEGKE